MEENLSANIEEVAETQLSEEQESSEETLSANIEEVAETQTDESSEGVQDDDENSKYANIRRKAQEEAESKASAKYSEIEKQLTEAQNNPQLAFMKEVASKYGYEDLEKYQEAVKTAWEQEEIDKLVEKNIPVEYAKEMLENRKFREEQTTKSKESEETAKTEKENAEFLEEYKDVDIKTIPWEQINELRAKGHNLTAAYAIHLARNIDTVKTEAQQDAIKKMSENAETSIGSINDQTSQEEGKMSNTQVNSLLESMTSADRNKWLDKNYDMLEKSGYFKNS